jgi:hypothetical protein
MEDRRVQVFDFDALCDTADRVLVIGDRFVGGLAVDVTAAEGATEDCRAEADWPVVSTVSDIDLWGSAKFAAAENHGGIQKVTGFEQADQGCQSGIQDCALTGLKRVVFDMRIPTAEFDLDAGNTLFDKSNGR